MFICVHLWFLIGFLTQPAHAQSATALPTGGQIAAGTGTLATSGSTLTVQQTSPTLAVNWQSFDIGADATVDFVQPGRDAVALNRVLGADASQIYGKLNANGQVFLVNPNGILFGRTAQVNVGGLVASTLDLADADFLAGRRHFSGTPGAVTNQGTLTGGYVALLGGQVSNQGTITAKLGTVALAAGSDVTLDFAGDGLLGVQVNRGALDALAENKQLIRADGGTVLMTAQAANALTTAAVNNTGVIEARTLENRGGTIKLLGDMAHGTVNVAGTLDASAPVDGNGGFVETSAARVNIADGATITTKAPSGRSGTWLIDPVDFTIAASGGDITGTTLSTNLGAGNVTILSTSGTTGTAGNVNVNDTVTWSANTLTLNAQNNIAINRALNGSGTAGLALHYGQGAVAAGNTSTYHVNAPVNLASTGSFSTKLGSDGVVKNYTILTSLGAAGSVTGTDLQGMAGNLAGSYVLGADIDASATATWNANGSGGYYGFAPVGDSVNKFTGVFDGLGHSIDSLYINRPATEYVGLFGFANAATLRNVGLTNASVSGLGHTGALAGKVDGVASITNSHAAANVTGGGDNVGGLVGRVLSGVTVSGSYASGSVVGTGSFSVGGLIGAAHGNLSNSYSTSSVTGNDYVGGLVGYLQATTTNTYATGTVSGNDRVGGLAGRQSGTVSNSYSTGAVSGNTNVGGLFGIVAGVITNSYWDTQTSGQATSAGGAGAVGKTTAEMKQLATFAGWDIDAAGGTGKVWRIYDGHTTPLLRGFLTPLNVQPTYDGSGAALTNIGAVTPVGAYDAGKVFAGSLGAETLTLSSTAANAYTATSTANNLYSNQTGYDLVLGTRTIATTGSAAGDIVLTTPISWSSGTLAINTTGTVTQTAAINGTGAAVFNLQAGAWRQVNATLPGFAAYDFRISGGTFVRALSGDGTVGTPYQLADIYGIQGMGTGLANHYTLANDVDASGTVNWNAGAGFVPVGNSTTKFTGSFDGLGHTVTGLTINRPDWLNAAHIYQGLFGYADVGSTLRNVGLLNSSIYGAMVVGTLAGRSDGTISNSYADGGSVTTSVHQAGGLVGQLGGSLNNSYANVSVSGAGAGGAVSTSIGGLVGVAAAGSSIGNSYAAGSVSAGDAVGGLVGQNRANINTSYASGAVTATASYRGGFIGDQLSGTITNSYWDSATTGLGRIGGTSSGGGGTVTSLTDIAAAPHVQANYTGFDFTNTWRIYEGHTRPLLKSFLTPLTVTATNASRAYDGTAYSGGNGVTYSTAPNANLLGTLSYSGTSQGATNAGSYVLTPGGLYSNQRGYDITYANGSLVIDPRAVTFTGTRTYDGTTAIAGSVLSLDNLVTGDTVTLTGSGTLASRNAGTQSLANNGTLALDNANYTLTGATGSVTITPATLTLTASTDTKIYDGTTASTGTVNVTGLVAGDTLTGLTQSYTSKNVLGANGSTLAVNAGYTLSDGNAGANYTVTTATATGTITPAALTLTASTGTKTYDGTTTSTGTVAVTGLAAGDTLSGLTQSYTSKNVLGANSSTLAVNTGYTLADGNSGGNYTVTTANAVGTITPAALTLAASSDTKTYDGTTTSTGTVNATGLVAGDTLTGLTQSYASKNALGANGSTLAVNSGYTLADGNGGANYTVTTANAVGTIDPLAITFTGTRTYDGTTAIAGSVLSFGNLVSGDTVAATGSGTLASRNAGTQSLASSGALALDNANYTLTGATGNVTITPAALTLTASSDTKAYDGTTASTGVVNVTGLVAGDTLTGLTQSYASKNVLGANGSTLAVNSGYTLTDGNAGANYTVTTTSATGTITPAALTLVASTDSKTYDGTTASTGTVAAAGLVAGDTLTGLTQSYTSKNVLGANGSTLAVNTGYTLADGNAGNNYTITTTNAIGTITPAALTLAAITDSKTYDGTTTSTGTVAATGLVAGDTLTGLMQSYTSKNVLGANGSTLVVNTGYTLADGNSGANYAVTTTNATGTITPAALTLAASTDTKTYDGTIASTGTVAVTGLVAGDTLTGLTQSYASKNVLGANGSTLTVNAGYTLADGNSGNNYTITTTNATGTIDPRAVTLTGTRTYDGTTAIAGSALSVTNLAAGDSVALTGGATLAGSELGTHELGDLGTLALDNANYTLAGARGSVTIVVPPTIDPGANPALVSVLHPGFRSAGEPAGNAGALLETPPPAEVEMVQASAADETPKAETDEDKRRKRKSVAPGGSLLVIEGDGIRLPAGLTMSKL